jgi:hypothetical protein
MAGLSHSFPILQTGDRTALQNLSSATSQYILVRSTADTTFGRTAVDGERCDGVLQDTPSSGEPGNVMLLGVSVVRVNSTAHTAIAVGDKLMCSTNGGALPSTGGVAQYVVGRAWQTLAANTTGLIPMLITHQGGGSTGAGAAA